jgi:hypothetical protein
VTHGILQWWRAYDCTHLRYKRTEFGKPHACRGSVCASGDCLWCGEPYFVDAVISVDRFLPQIPRRWRWIQVQVQVQVQVYAVGRVN